MGAALATTLADLHEIGVVHLAVEPEHVLIDGDGRPVLCGFGSARYACATSPEGWHQFGEWCRNDVMALAKLLAEGGGDSLGGRASSVLAAAAHGQVRRGLRGRPIDARHLAGVLAAAATATTVERERGVEVLRYRALSTPSARDPAVASAGAGAGAAAGAGACAGRRRTAMILGGSLAATGIAVATTVWPTKASRPATARQPQQRALSSSVGPCPAQDQGCSPIVTRAGLVAPGVTVVGISGVTVVGRWDCRATATPAVLDPRTGNLWVFDSWPASGQKSVGRLVTKVHGGSTLQVVPPANQGRCDRIEIYDRGHPLRLIDPRRPDHGTRQ